MDEGSCEFEVWFDDEQRTLSFHHSMPYLLLCSISFLPSTSNVSPLLTLLRPSFTLSPLIGIKNWHTCIADSDYAINWLSKIKLESRQLDSSHNNESNEWEESNKKRSCFSQHFGDKRKERKGKRRRCSKCIKWTHDSPFLFFFCCSSYRVSWIILDTIKFADTISTLKRASECYCPWVVVLSSFLPSLCLVREDDYIK